MSPEQDLTNERLCGLADERRRSFREAYLPFPKKHIDAIKKCSDLVTGDPKYWPRNAPKRRSRKILVDISTHSSELFVLVALSVTPTKLGTLKSDDYLQVLHEWWSSVHHPKGLEEAIQRHSDILPSNTINPQPDPRPYCSTLKRDDLLDFLQNHPRADGLYHILIPVDAHERPFIQISSEMCLDLIRHVMEKTRHGLQA